MPSIVSLQLPHHHLFSDYIPRTHLQKTTSRRQNRGRFATAPPRTSISSNADTLDSKCSLTFLAPLEAVLFDIDGTLCDSEPLHYDAFHEMLQEVGFNGGVPITKEFFIEKISGRHNEDLCGILFPDWDLQRSRKFLDDKEALFRRLASEELKPVNGLRKLLKWIEERGLKRAAVTNASRSNAELLISMLGLSDYFKTVVLANECDRPKPSPDPYLKALQALGLSHKHAFVFEDSVSGIKAGLAAGMPVVGLALRNPEKKLAEAGATFIIKDFDDPKLWMALEELEGKAEVTTATT
ncbi:hypothetical protein L1049_017867 [Liquidambar formosana]|uniref:Haloacid dehalogenase-like hydrolase domain-containing protein Sgpp n=1 Tax=Liquidambar formosana TaxID=63359 RepID=A0AAP0R831_LIQFO